MTDKPLLPVVSKFQEALNVVQRMFTENRTMHSVGNMAAEDEEHENRRLARDREHIGILADVLQGLLAAMLATIREEGYDAIALKLKEALQVAKAMLAENVKAAEMLSGLPPERRREESEKHHRDFELIKALVNIVSSVTDGVEEGQCSPADKPPIDRK
ncbi:MAG: hypothetical protein ABSG68_17970 [Thermoguttaceae bacterium]|jgi:hypothetical protein